MNLPSVHVDLTLARHVTPDENDLVLLAAAFYLGATGFDGGGGGESELEGDAAFGGGDMFSSAFGAEVDLVGWVEAEVVARMAAGVSGGRC